VKVSSSLGVKAGAVAVTGVLCLSGCGSGGANKTQPNSTLPTLPPSTLLPPSTTLPPTTAAAVPTVYIVQKGDSLTRIATHFGVTVAQLVAANDIHNQDHIEEGQRLTIPPPTVAATTTAPGSTTTARPATTAAPTTTHR
jgi:LysM repeat protein